MFKKFKQNNLKNNKGVSLIEVIIASSIISLFMISISSVYGNFLQLSLENTYKTQAVFLLDEGVEAMKTIRGYSWVSIASSTVNTDYYIVWQDNKWQSTTTANIIDNIFVRKYTVDNVYRDPSNLNIVYTGGVLDTNSRIINMDVSWNYKRGTTTKKISFYIFNIYE